jgi:hypothetical protein
MKGAIMKWCMIICSLAFLFVPAANAEYYQYVDDSGQVVYTDDITTVPNDRRVEVQAYQELKMPVEALPKVETVEDINGNTGEAASPMMKRRDALTVKTQQLIMEFNTLDGIREKLEEDRAAVRTKRGAVRTKEATIAYKENLAEFTRKAAEYEKKRAELSTEVEAFNAELTSGGIASQKDIGGGGTDDDSTAAGELAVEGTVEEESAAERDKLVTTFEMERLQMELSQEEIYKEYQRLTDEKKSLDARNKTRMNRPDLTALKEDYRAYQKKKDAYDQWVRSHEARVEDYNGRLKASGLAVADSGTADE